MAATSPPPPPPPPARAAPSSAAPPPPPPPPPPARAPVPPPRQEEAYEEEAAAPALSPASAPPPARANLLAAIQGGGLSSLKKVCPSLAHSRRTRLTSVADLRRHRHTSHDLLPRLCANADGGDCCCGPWRRRGRSSICVGGSAEHAKGEHGRRFGRGRRWERGRMGVSRVHG